MTGSELIAVLIGVVALVTALVTLVTSIVVLLAAQAYRSRN